MTLLVLVLCLAPSLGAASPSGITSFQQLYVIGDSLSDTGNLATILGCMGDGFVTSANCPGVPPDAQNFGVVLKDRKFSNGDLYVQKLDQEVQMPGGSVAAVFGGDNHAVAGTLANPSLAPFWSPFVPGTDVASQAGRLVAQEGPLNSNGLVVLFIGSNDVFGAVSALGQGVNVTSDLRQSAAIIANTIKYLNANGAKNFLVFEVANIARTPGLQSTLTRTQLAVATTLSLAFNAQLLTRVSALSADRSFSGKVWYFPSFAVGEFLASPLGKAATGLRSTTPCAPIFGYGQDCSTSQFWDTTHPTEGVHSLLADTAKTLLKLNPLVRK